MAKKELHFGVLFFSNIIVFPCKSVLFKKSHWPDSNRRPTHYENQLYMWIFTDIFNFLCKIKTFHVFHFNDIHYFLTLFNIRSRILVGFQSLHLYSNLGNKVNVGDIPCVSKTGEMVANTSFVFDTTPFPWGSMFLLFSTGTSLRLFIRYSSTVEIFAVGTDNYLTISTTGLSVTFSVTAAKHYSIMRIKWSYCSYPVYCWGKVHISSVGKSNFEVGRCNITNHRRQHSVFYARCITIKANNNFRCRTKSLGKCNGWFGYGIFGAGYARSGSLLYIRICNRWYPTTPTFLSGFDSPKFQGFCFIVNNSLL